MTDVPWGVLLSGAPPCQDVVYMPKIDGNAHKHTNTKTKINGTKLTLKKTKRNRLVGWCAGGLDSTFVRNLGTGLDLMGWRFEARPVCDMTHVHERSKIKI